MCIGKKAESLVKVRKVDIVRIRVSVQIMSVSPCYVLCHVTCVVA